MPNAIVTMNDDKEEEVLGVEDHVDIDSQENTLTLTREGDSPPVVFILSDVKKVRLPPPI